MKPITSSIVTIVFLILLAGCTPTVQTPTNTLLMQETTPQDSTTPTPTDRVLEMTLAYKDEALSTHVYSFTIGCLATVPCLGKPVELFKIKSPVRNMNWSSNGKLLAFDSIDDSSFDIFIASENGTEINNITKTQEIDEISPQWSSDNTEIAYIAQSKMEASKILVSLANGANPQQILSDVFEPIQFVWSSQGLVAYSAYVSTTDGRYQIRIFNENGSLYWLIPLDDKKMGFGTANLAFSPDGKRLLYTRHYRK